MATGYTFDIDTDRGYFDRILTPAVDDYRKDQLSVVKALTTSVLLLQFTDWVFHCNTDVVAALPGSPKDEKELTTYFSKEWECYHSVRRIATGAKHFNVTNKSVSDVAATSLQHGFATGLLLCFTQSHLTVRLVDGSLRFIDKDILDCYGKWKEFVATVLKWQL